MTDTMKYKTQNKTSSKITKIVQSRLFIQFDSGASNESPISSSIGSISRFENIEIFHIFWILQFHIPSSFFRCWSAFFCSPKWQNWKIPNVQVNLCQKLLFLHQLTHNMTTDWSLFKTIVSSKYLQNMLSTQIVVFVWFWHSEQFWRTTCSADVASFWKRFTCTVYYFHGHNLLHSQKRINEKND